MTEIDVGQIRERLAGLEATVAAIKEAVEVAKAEIERRLEGMNQFRNQIERERGDFLQSEIYDREHKSLVDRITANEQEKLAVNDYSRDREDILKRLGTLEQNKAGISATVATFAAIISFMMSLALILARAWK